MSFLTPEEQEFVMEHVPATELLDDRAETLETVLGTKDRWIIKPLDSYASRGVFAGIDYTQEEWKDIVLRHTGKDYIYQEYCPPYRTDNIYLVDADAQFKPYTNMSGLLCMMVYFPESIRVFPIGGIISSQYNEKAVATLYVKWNFGIFHFGISLSFTII